MSPLRHPQECAADYAAAPARGASARDKAGPLAAKLNPPTASNAQLPREALAERIGQAGTARVVLVRAPAGFGKTTALLQARERLQQRGINTGWLTLDAADNDPSRFLACLTQVVHDLFGQDAGAAPGAAFAVRSATPVDPRSATGTARSALEVIASLTDQPLPFALIFDDFESIQEPSVLGLVRQIIDHLPRGGQLLIGSRSLPSLGLGRLRARGQLLEIDTDRLRFTLAETTEFLGERRHLALSPDDIATLHRKTEGWAAALWLASLALARRERRSEFVACFSGSDQALADYLADDVLAAQPAPVRKFLVRTSILRHLHAPLCDALMQRTDSAAMLAQLQAANLFLAPIDGEAGGYRYHSLFAGFLRTQLALEPADELARLHLTASHWYEREGRPVPAIDHAIDSGEHGEALELLTRHATALLSQGRMRLLARWFRALPEALLAGCPLLQMVAIWATGFTRGPREAMAMLQASGCIDSRLPAVQSHVRALRPVLMAMMDRPEDAYAAGQESLRHLPGHDAFADNVLTNAMAHVVAIMGEHRQAHRLLDAARRAQGASPFNRMYSESVEGLIDQREGRLQQATARFRIAVSATRTPSYTHGNAWAGVLYAGALYETNQLAQAEQLLNVYLPLACDVGLPDHMILGHTMRSRIAFWRGDVDQAFQQLIELEYLGHDRQLPRVSASAKLERARMLGLQGNGQASADELERADDPAVWSRTRQLLLPAHDIDDITIGRWRWTICYGDPGQALTELSVACAVARADGRGRRALRLQVLRAMAQQRMGDAAAAQTTMAILVQAACPEGFMRLMLDEGEPAGSLIRALAAAAGEAEGSAHTDPLLTVYLQRLAEALGPAAAALPTRSEGAAANALTLDALTRKEIRVLQLLAEGYSNGAMAEKLFVSDSTVRTHLRNINMKLDARSRTQAVAIGRRIGLIR